MENELHPEYDLKNSRVRKLGPKRRSFGETVRLETDIIETVNKALRFSLD